jgi:hypothetical protein
MTPEQFEQWQRNIAYIEALQNNVRTMRANIGAFLIRESRLVTWPDELNLTVEDHVFLWELKIGTY